MKRPRSECPHGAVDLPAAGVRSSKKACDACGGTEDLRVCQVCGYVGCCESHRAHDTAHFEATGHAFIRPRTWGMFSRDPGWLWCYLCRAYLEG
ncbi:MAG: UBP-type zinc finger domain-containing protein [Acidobacteriota bacterium]